MSTSAPAVRVLQEDRAPFFNLHTTARRFTEQTGIRLKLPSATSRNSGSCWNASRMVLFDKRGVRV